MGIETANLGCVKLCNYCNAQGMIQWQYTGPANFGQLTKPHLTYCPNCLGHGRQI